MMSKYLLIIPSLLLWVSQSYGQDLYVPPAAEVTLADGAILTAGGNIVNQGRFDIAEGTEASALGEVQNTGFFINNGLLNLFGNWSNQNTFNSSEGLIQFLGADNQSIFNQYLLVNQLAMDKIGSVTFLGDSVKITGGLNFLNGTMTVGSTTQFIIDEEADISHDDTGGSYFDGTIISRGTGFRTFPVGDGGYFGTISLIDIRGVRPELGISLIHQNPQSPIPGSDLVGVSGQNLWAVDYRAGSLDELLVQIDFIAEDLANFEIENEIESNFERPVVAISDNDPAGPFRSLGAESLTDTDSLTRGNIIPEEYAAFTGFGSAYFAIALGPDVDPNGQVYFPNVFSPLTTDPLNRTYRVFGERILDEPFRIEIYNQFNKLMYEANSFQEANGIGWDGTSSGGREEPMGIYFVYVTYAFENAPENIQTYNGSVLLQR